MVPPHITGTTCHSWLLNAFLHPPNYYTHIKSSGPLFTPNTAFLPGINPYQPLLLQSEDQIVKAFFCYTAIENLYHVCRNFK